MYGIEKRVKQALRNARMARQLRAYRRLRKKYPAKDYGRAFLKRGTEENIARYGKTWADAGEPQRLRRKADHYFGQGGYWGRKIGGYFGHPNVGSALGDIGVAALTAWNPAVGGAVSQLANSTAKVFSGQGEYVSNDIVNGGVGNPAPMFHANNEGTVVLSNREYIADIFAPSTAGAFVNQTFPLNPGIEKSFPWLCQVAENYEEYTLHQCIFTYKATVADFAAATGQVGQVVMATQYNASAAPFADKQTMMQYSFACSGKTSQDLLQGVECDPRKLSGARGHFVRNGPIPVGVTGDLNLYDHGTLNIAISDCPSGYVGQQMGELWVSYTVELRKPKFVTANGWGIGRDYFFATRTDARFPFQTGANAYLGQQNSIGIQLVLPPAPGVTIITPYTDTQNMIALSVPGVISSTDWFSFGLLFPNYYSGNIRLLYHMLPISANYNQVFNVFARSGANVRRISDIPQSATNAGTITSWSSTTPLDPNSQNVPVTVEIHFRVDTPVNGVSNLIIFSVPNTAVNQTNNGFIVDVSEYNTSFNLKQDGTNDRISLVSYATGQIANLG